jgi:hypothetical protein
MIGRYLIYTPADSMPDERRFDAAWRRFAEICRSLHRDGLDYSVRLNLADTRPHVLVTASGKAKPRRQAGARAGAHLPPPVPVERCRELAIEVEWFLPENREWRKDGGAYWAKHQARYQELSGMAEEFLRAELEYWRELELLSGQRARFKPGLTDETAYADDEVAA